MVQIIFQKQNLILIYNKKKRDKISRDTRQEQLHCKLLNILNKTSTKGSHLGQNISSLILRAIDIDNWLLYSTPEFVHSLSDYVLEPSRLLGGLGGPKNSISGVQFKNKPSRVGPLRSCSNQEPLPNGENFYLDSRFNTNLFPKVKEEGFLDHHERFSQSHLKYDH